MAKNIPRSHEMVMPQNEEKYNLCVLNISEQNKFYKIFDAAIQTKMRRSISIVSTLISAFLLAMRKYKAQLFRSVGIDTNHVQRRFYCTHFGKGPL